MEDLFIYVLHNGKEFRIVVVLAKNERDAYVQLAAQEMEGEDVTNAIDHLRPYWKIEAIKSVDHSKPVCAVSYDRSESYQIAEGS